jgi:hypothetical protein
MNTCSERNVYYRGYPDGDAGDCSFLTTLLRWQPGAGTQKRNPGRSYSGMKGCSTDTKEDGIDFIEFLDNNQEGG